jgi:hypothetical protein
LARPDFGKEYTFPKKKDPSPVIEENDTEIWSVMLSISDEGLLLKPFPTNHLDTATEIIKLASENLQRGCIEFHFN